MPPVSEHSYSIGIEGGHLHEHTGKHTLVCLRRTFERAGMGIVRLSVVHHDHRDTDWPAVFQFASLAFFPFGKEVVYGGGAVSLLANIVWLIVSGIPMAVGNAAIGVVCYITIIGFPLASSSSRSPSWRFCRSGQR